MSKQKVKFTVSDVPTVGTVLIEMTVEPHCLSEAYEIAQRMAQSVSQNSVIEERIELNGPSLRLVEALCCLLPSQFEVLIFRLGLSVTEQAHLVGPSCSMRIRAEDLVRKVDSDRICKALEKTAPHIIVNRLSLLS